MDFGSRITMEGCDVDFLDRLPSHLRFIGNFFLSHGIILGNNLRQLIEIERFITGNRGIKELHTHDFFQGLVAHCGELLQTEVSGQWKMVTSKASAIYSKDRHFPAIVDRSGQEYEFSAAVEHQLVYLLNPELNWDKMDGLYYAMQFQLVKKVDWLPVKKIDSWFFPPLDEAVE